MTFPRRGDWRSYLIVRSSFLGQSKDGGNAYSQVKSSDEIYLRFLDQVPNVWLLQVLKLIVVGGGEMSAQAAVMASDDDATAARGLVLVNAIFRVDAGFFADVCELLAMLIFSDATNVGDGVGWENILNCRDRSSTNHARTK